MGQMKQAAQTKLIPVEPEQPWHAGERMLQKKQGTVGFSNELGPHIYHKVIPASYRDMVGPQPQFMVSFFDPETPAVWASVVFAPPEFADCNTSGGERIDLAAALDPRDGAAKAGLVKPGTLVGGVAIDFMRRRRNRFNGVVGRADSKSGHFSINITQAFGNCPKYITRRRVVRMGANKEFEDIAEPVRTTEVVAHPEDVAIITQADNMYLGTATASDGADMNIRGGSPGFVRVLDGGARIAWPDYTGNGFYMSLGNAQLQKSAGLVFVDWDATGRGVQVSGDLQTIERNSSELDAALLRVLEQESQALRLVVMSVRSVRSIPQYCPHRYERVELSPYNPRALGAAGPEFTAIMQWERDECKGVKTFEFQLAPLPRAGTAILKPGQHVRLALPQLKKSAGAAPPERTWTVTSSPQWFADHGRFQISVKLKEDGLASTFLHNASRLAAAKPSALHLDFLGFAGEFGPQLDAYSGSLRSKAEMPRHVVFLVGGIGVTPAAAAVRAIAEAEPRPETLTVLYSVRDASDLAFLELFVKLGPTLREVNVGLTVHTAIFLTGPNAVAQRERIYAMLAPLRPQLGRSFTVEVGRLSSIEILQKHMPDAAAPGKSTTECFVCGSPSFEATAKKLWIEAGYPATSLRSESFAY